MKPLRGKRVGSAQSAGRISTAAVRRDRLRDGWEGRRGRWLGGPPRPPSREGRGAHPPSVTAPRQQRSPNPGAEGADRRARGVSRRHAVTKAQRSERTGSAAMSATHPTRLETRTKESNTCASQGLARKPPWRNEGEGRRARARAARRPRWDPEASPVRRGRTTGPSRPPRRGGGA